MTCDTVRLSPGEYRGAITISDPSAANNPQNVAVHLTLRAFAAEPIIVNPDFEDDYPRAFFVATGWSSFGGNKWEQAYDSERRWTQGITDIPPGGEGGVFQTISVSPGVRYGVSTHAQAQTLDYEVSIGVDLAGSGNVEAATFGAPSSSGSWTQLTQEITASGPSATLFLRVRNKATYWIHGKWSLFDGVRIETIGTSTNIPPEVFITSPADGATFISPADITVSAYASDMDGTVTKVEFLNGSELLGEDTDSPYSVTVSQVSSGSYNFTARATDDEGAVTTSRPVHVAVNGTPPPQRGKSKLSIHIGFTGPLSMQFIREAKPRIVKILDSFGQASEIKQVSPDTQIIGRIFLTSQPMDGNATQRAQEWWNRTRNLILQYPAVDYWEGYNEPIIHTQDQMSWYATFEASRVEILARHGLKACIGNFSTGNPDLALWPAFFPAIDQALARGGILRLHEYGTPMQQWYESDIGEGWLCGRFRKVYRQHLIPGNRVIPLAITETGVDGIPPVGWKNHFSEEEYFEQLVWYDSLLLQDAFVLGATVFSLEIPNWFDFDIAPIMDLLTNHVWSGTFNQPPTVSITHPANGENFAAPATIDLIANAFDTDGTVSKVEFFNSGEKLGEDPSAPYSHTWSGVSEGTYTLIAKAIDDQGAVATSTGVRITVGSVPATNLMANGDLSQGLSHSSRWTERGALNPTVNESGQLHLAAIGHNGGMYQTFATGGAGTVISIDGVWASGPTASLQWAEVLVINGGELPVDGRDLTAVGNNVLLIYKNDSAAGWSGPMSQETTVSSNGTFVAAGATATIVLKSGNLPGVYSGTLFDDIVVHRSP